MRGEKKDRRNSPPRRAFSVHLYAERGSPKFEKAAIRWLERYLTEGEPRLQHFAEVTASLAERELEPGGAAIGLPTREVPAASPRPFS